MLWIMASPVMGQLKSGFYDHTISIIAKNENTMHVHNMHNQSFQEVIYGKNNS
ncbi:MAG: hypothetical protein SVW57_10190 [Thermodesulfobacteriota bacterium]|nr:hypothetical protein [Thermodesulfobacteriota bacterium]